MVSFGHRSVGLEGEDGPDGSEEPEAATVASSWRHGRDCEARHRRRLHTSGAPSRSRPPSTVRFTPPHSFTVASSSRHNEARPPGTAPLALRGHLVDARRTSHSSANGAALSCFAGIVGHSFDAGCRNRPAGGGERERERATIMSPNRLLSHPLPLRSNVPNIPNFYLLVGLRLLRGFPRLCAH